MTDKPTRLNIFSKLNFENITTTQNFANVINDNNPYTKLTWNTFSSSATMECIVSDNIKYANLSSNYNRFRTQISYFNDRSFNFIIKFRLTELRSIQNIVTINNGATHFVCNIKNTFNDGLSLYNSDGGISINCNYKFEADVDYVISISKDEDIYKVIINGTQYLCTENSKFKNNLPSSSSNNLILGGIDISASNSANSLRGRLYWANLSVGTTMIFNGSYTKYGSSLKSFLYFGNKAINDTATSYYAPLEAIEDSIITWNGLENINAENVSLNSLICTGTNSFYTNYNINDLFTLTFKCYSNVALDGGELISYYGYKLLVTNVVNDTGNPDVSVNTPVITPVETIYTLTDGTNTETIPLSGEAVENEITFYNKENSIDVKINDDNNVMSLPKNTVSTDNTLTINNGFKGTIKDIKLYDTVIPFNDSDSFIDYDPYNTEFNQVQVEIINDDFTELNTMNIGNNNITGFLEGCILPISYDIIHKSTGAILTSGNTPYYSYNNIDIRYIDEYVIIDSNNKEYELINKSLDKEGFLIFILDARSCQGNLCIRLYKHLTGKFVGEYEIINNQCQIDHLFIDERYDAVLFDRDSNIESKTLSDRIPEIKIV